MEEREREEREKGERDRQTDRQTVFNDLALNRAK